MQNEMLPVGLLQNSNLVSYCVVLIFLGLGIGSEILKNLSQVCLSDKSKQAELSTCGKAVLLFQLHESFSCSTTQN